MGTSLRELRSDLQEPARRFTAEVPQLLSQALGVPVRFRINSVRRDLDQQRELWENFQRCGCSSCSSSRSGCFPVAKPGSSPHALGIAWDMNVEPRVAVFRGRRIDLVRVVGLLWEAMGYRWGGRFSQPDPVHFDFHPRGWVPRG